MSYPRRGIRAKKGGGTADVACHTLYAHGLCESS